jgi:Zn-dependent peptidase ImmA (M78 family)
MPVPLDRLMAGLQLAHEEVPELSRAVAGAYLDRWGIHRPELLGDRAPLAGFLFANAAGGCILVCRGDNLARRRFTAAHELGHYLLHFLPRLQRHATPEDCLVQADDDETVQEGDGIPLAVMEHQANSFAAELLMPEAVCRALHRRFSERMGPTTRFLEHHLSSALLVSPEAARLRLRALRLTGTSPADRPVAAPTAGGGP